LPLIHPLSAVLGSSTASLVHSPEVGHSRTCVSLRTQHTCKMSGRVSKAMTQPLTVIFRFLQSVGCLPTAGIRHRRFTIARAQLLQLLALAIHDPIALQKARIQIWLYEQASMRIEGRIIVSDPPQSISSRNFSACRTAINSPRCASLHRAGLRRVHECRA